MDKLSISGIDMNQNRGIPGLEGTCVQSTKNTSAIYQSSSPYPPLQVKAPDRRYAAMLRYDMASRGGELTAITEYVYNTWMLHAEYPQIAQTMHHIAIVEMHHLDMLGQLVILLGGDPVYASAQSNQIQPWNGRMPRYGKTLDRIMRQNLEAERATIALYEKQAHIIKDPGICAVLLRIVEDEKIHAAIFETHLRS